MVKLKYTKPNSRMEHTSQVSRAPVRDGAYFPNEGKKRRTNGLPALECSSAVADEGRETGMWLSGLIHPSIAVAMGLLSVFPRQHHFVEPCRWQTAIGISAAVAMAIRTHVQYG